MTEAIAWGLVFAAEAGICCGISYALASAGLSWLRTQTRPAKPQARPRPARPIGPHKPYQQGSAPVPCDLTPTERIRRIRDHAPRLARRPM